jgi:hypothetical protein
VNVVADATLEADFEYDTEMGGGSDGYDYQTAIVSTNANVPIEVVMGGLTANMRYHYRMVYRDIGETQSVRNCAATKST